MELIGWIGSLLFGICGFPQAYQCYKDGHAKGISSSFIWLWTGGEIFTFIYVAMLPITSWPLIANYTINLISVIMILKYKYWERKYEKGSWQDKYINGKWDKVNPKSWPPHKDLGYAVSCNRITPENPTVKTYIAKQEKPTINPTRFVKDTNIFFTPTTTGIWRDENGKTAQELFPDNYHDYTPVPIIRVGVRHCSFCDKEVSSIDSHTCLNGERRN